MTFNEAILVRLSNRKYLDRPLSEEELSLLDRAVRRLNTDSGLRMQLVTEEPEAFGSLRKSYGMFSNVRNYIAMVGPSGDHDLLEKCGYYGEQLVLLATTMGLGTCWVAATYDRSACAPLAGQGETLCCVIAVGPVAPERGLREKMVRGVTHRKSKTLAELARGMGEAPDWFMAGAAAVQRAPSGMNRQPILMRYENGSVSAELAEETPYCMIDLGIAKYHFEVGAHGGTWTWGAPGYFEKAREEKSCGAVVWRDTPQGHQYLLVQHNARHWSFPKGHVEKGEREEDTARREILEETGLAVSVDTSFREVVTYYPKPGVVKDVIFFLAQPTGGTEHAQEDEIANLGWFSYQDAYPLVTFATDAEVLQAAEERILSRGR